jgi:hypothetical protein
VPLPPHLRRVVSQLSATITDRFLDITGPLEHSVEPSSSMRRTHSQTCGLATGKFLFIFIFSITNSSLFLLLEFGAIQNDGIG